MQVKHIYMNVSQATNGYIVEFRKTTDEPKPKRDSKDAFDDINDYEYSRHKFIFSTYEQVQQFIRENV